MWENNYSVYNAASFYGGYRTRTFAKIFPSKEIFIEECNSSGFGNIIEGLDTLYFLLYARYGNSHIAFNDETQFKYAMYSTIFMYGPSWEKRLEIQKELISLDLGTGSEIYMGSKAIYNTALNPGTAPSTQTLDELTAINQQNTTNYKKSKLEGLSTLYALIQTDVTEEFIGKFKKHFLAVVAPSEPLLYETLEDN